jgi:hypothetical protein
MKNLRCKETGEEIQVHEVDARDLINSGGYEDLGSVPAFVPSRATTVAELAGKITPEYKGSLERIAALEDQAVLDRARIAELEALVEAKGNQQDITPPDFDVAACEDLDRLKAYAKANGISVHYNAGLAKVKAAILVALEPDEA